MKKNVLSLIVCVLMVGGAYGTIGDIWDLGTSHSETDNPFGPDAAFSLHDATGTPLVVTADVFWAPWFGDGWGVVGQEFPSALMPSDHGNHGEAANELMIQPAGGLMARWTSPINGVVQVDAYHGQGGWNQTSQSGYQYYVDGVLQSSAYIPWPVSDNLWPANTFGITADLVNVSIGTTIDFVVVTDGPEGDGGTGAVSSALSMTITEVPEPTTLVLLGLGGLSLIRRRK